MGPAWEISPQQLISGLNPMNINFYDAFRVTKLASTAIVSIFGFCLFFLTVPRDEVLHNYRVCRKLLGAAYWIFAGINILGYFLRHYYPHISHSYVNGHLTLIAASYQALFLPLALVTLINADYLDRKKIRLGVIPISLLSFLSISFFFLTVPDWLVKTVFWGFLSYYVWQLVTSIRLIITESRAAGKMMDDYFSSRKTLNIGWMRSMGIISNSCGVIALLMILIRSWVVAFLVLLYISTIYTILAVEYLNYIYVFNLVAPVVHTGETRPKYQKSKISGLDVDSLLRRLSETMTSKKPYRDAGLTIVQLSREIDVTPHQLSELLNDKLDMNFHKFVNSFRIQDAKALLENEAEKSIIDIAFDCGFNSKSNFNQVFKNETGKTPGEWRRVRRSMPKKTLPG
jgi:AraC-like DNA-binding protein